MTLALLIAAFVVVLVLNLAVAYGLCRDAANGDRDELERRQSD